MGISSLAQKVGEDPTVEEGAQAPWKRGLFSELTKEANPKLIEDAAERSRT